MTVILPENALIPYYTLCDPDYQFSKTLILESFKSGADAIEIGIPFSDPIADGPVIQQSHQRVLASQSDINLKNGFDLVKDIRRTEKKPLIFMMDANLLLKYGVEKFFKDANKVGLNGVIIPNLALNDAEKMSTFAKKSKVDLILLVSPFSDSKRVKKIVSLSSGFVYVISSSGTTGERTDFNKSLESFVKSIKKISLIPALIGFGISHPKQFRDICSYADGGIVGSHFIRVIEDNLSNKQRAIKLITDRIREFKLTTTCR